MTVAGTSLQRFSASDGPGPYRPSQSAELLSSLRFLATVDMYDQLRRWNRSSPERSKMGKVGVFGSADRPDRSATQGRSFLLASLTRPQHSDSSACTSPDCSIGISRQHLFCQLFLGHLGYTPCHGLPRSTERLHSRPVQTFVLHE